MNTSKLIYVKHNKGVYALPISPNIIPYTELTIVSKGTMEYIVDRESIVLHEGDAILIPKGALRERKKGMEASDYISFNFLLDEELELPRFLPKILTRDVRFLIAACDEIQQIHISAYEEAISHLLNCVLVTIKSNLQRQSSHPLVEKIIRYLHENISEKITLSDIAQHTFFSAIYCDSVFKKEMGVSIIDYLLEERIGLAKQLLTEGSLSLRQIAETSGFSDYNYFARTFKKRTGYTPTQYRKSISPSLYNENF